MIDKLYLAQRAKTSGLNNVVPSITTYNLSSQYSFGKDNRYTAFLTINNILDSDPPVAPGNNSANFIPTNFELYETIGRYYTAGLRFKF